MIIVDIKIGIDGIPSEKSILLGNKYENNDTIINFELPSDFDTYKKYIITVNRNTTRILPLTDDRLVVSSALTELAGNWAMYLMCRELTIDLSVDNPDISAKDNEHVFISDGFIGTVANIQIDRRLVETIPLDTNLKIVYDDLMDLKAELLARIAGIDEYYTKTDTNTNDISNLKTNKVDKVEGKGLSTEDYTTEEKSKLAGLSNYDDTTVKQDISNLKTNKVDKVEGKGLSTEDYTTEEKSKLAGLSNYDDTTVKQDISNLKTNKVDKVEGKGLSTEDYTTEEKSKLAGLSNYDDTTVKQDISNLKTNKVDKVEGKGLSANDFTNEEKDKLSSLSNYDDSQIKGDLNELKGDLGELKGDFNEIVETKIGRNLFDTSKVTNDCVFKSTGAIATGMSAYCISDFINVDGGENVSINLGYQFAWFDENKNFLQFASDRSTSYSVIVAPSNAKYIRISIAKSELNCAMIVKTDENIPIQPSDYEPYKLERIVRKNVLPKIEKEDLPHIDYTEKIMDKFRYLMFTFAGALNKPDNLIILGSNDGETFDIVKKTGTYTCKNTYHDTKNEKIAVNGLRDPSVIKIGQWYYITYTVIGWNRGSEIGMCRTKDFEEYEELDNLYLTNENGNEFTRVWAPAWLQDEHNIYLCVGCEYDSAFRMYLMDYDFITHTITAKHNTGIGSNDYHFYYENGMYYALANDYALKSNNLFGEYTVIRHAIDGGKIEGDIAIRTDDGKYRVYVALINGYSDTDGIGMYELDSLSATTRPAIRPITLTDEARAYQTELGYLYTHPSIYDFNDETIIRGDISNILKRLDALEK